MSPHRMRNLELGKNELRRSRAVCITWDAEPIRDLARSCRHAIRDQQSREKIEGFLLRHKPLYASGKKSWTFSCERWLTQVPLYHPVSDKGQELSSVLHRLSRLNRHGRRGRRSCIFVEVQKWIKESMSVD